MIPNDDHKRLFLDMQEHPENYSDEQLEAMMDDLDSELDAQAAWERFEQTMGPAVKPTHRWLRVAAIFVGFLFLAGIAVAAWMSLTPNTPPSGETSRDAQSVEVATPTQHDEMPVAFDNVPLDSILAVVSAHYGKAVSFRNADLRGMKLIMTWQPDASLADFLDRLNAFDGLSLSLQSDTIVVEEETTDEE
jgi:hypothetical protein